MKKSVCSLIVALLLVSSMSGFVFAEEKNSIDIASIKLLKQLEGTKVENKIIGEKKHGDAIKLLKNYAAKKNITINFDLDDVGFQTLAKNAAVDFDSFNIEDMAKIIEFAKFIDLYENYGHNEKILKVKNKIQKNQEVTDQDLSDISNLLPTAENVESTRKNKTSPNGIPLQDPLNHYENEVAPYSSIYDYSRTTARDYAYEWWNGRNNSKYGYYSNYYNCYDCWNDCTNFVSQSLVAGGMVTWSTLSGDHNWFYSNNKPSHSWGGAHNFYNHWRNRANLAPNDTDLTVGDAVNADFSNDGHIDHTALVTSSDWTGPLVTQHTSDKKDARLENWFDAGYIVYGWEMDYANYYMGN